MSPDSSISQSNTYLSDTYKFDVETRAICTGRNNQGAWVGVAENIAHPQGGGQPADIVMINGRPAVPVFDANRFAADVPVLLQMAEADLPAKGAKIILGIDADIRRRHAALHTAGHVLHWILKDFGWTAVKGNHFPKESRVEFRAHDGQQADPWDHISETIAQRCPEFLAQEHKVTAWMEGASRITEIEGTEQMLCAGTHVEHLGQIAGFSLIKGKVKKGLLKVRYDAFHADP